MTSLLDVARRRWHGRTWFRAVSTWRKPLLLGATVGLLVVAGAIAQARWLGVVERDLVGIDYQTYVAYARRFLETGSQYLPYQLVGPYLNQPLVEPALIPSTYPPTALALFVPFLWLPAVLWWAVPLGVLAWSLAGWRPALAAWPLFAACLVWPETTTMVMVGNSTMWVVAVAAAALRWGWPAAFVIFKPSLAFVAVIGLRRPSFWLLLGGSLVVSLLLLPEWLRWFIALRNGSVAITYSIGSIPALLIPLLAWMARRRPEAFEPAALDLPLAPRRPATVKVEIG